MIEIAKSFESTSERSFQITGALVQSGV